ncbi:MAG: hypothetical protein QM668_02820 [Agriterribacter sp.]
MKTIVMFFCFVCSMVSGYAQQPLYYWTFDDTDYLKSNYGNKTINANSYKNQVQAAKGIRGNALYTNTPDKLYVTNIFSAQEMKDFSLEFAFSGHQFLFTSFPAPDFRISFNQDMLTIIATVWRKSAKEKITWSVPLTGTGVTSYNYLTQNNSWHYFVFSLSCTGKMEIWIDGKTDKDFVKTIAPFDQIAVEGGDGWRTEAAIDELAIYSNVISVSSILRHWNELNRQQEYTFSTDASRTAARANSDYNNYTETYVLDEKEFAPGYPDYTIQATDQLKVFPLPRYAGGVNMPPNFPWMDITYLHRELPSPGGKGFGKINPAKAVELTDELVKNWHYYIELPTLRTDSVTALQRYADPAQIYGRLIQYANNNPQFPAATIFMEVQNKPADAGLGNTQPYVQRQDLDSKYYLSDINGTPVVYNKKKWLNPFTATNLIEKDALTSVFYIRQLASHLTRPVNMINENGEWFGHQWKTDLLQKSPQVTTYLQKNQMDDYRFNGWMQNRFDSVYKTIILNNIPWKDVKFTFYNVSAYNSSYWPDYTERINTNTYFNGTPRSTPAFYPARPDNWRTASGPRNGYGTVAEGRKREIALGVKCFAPFVSPGWGLEENNIRPGQWLGLLKAMVMLGADFFHVGYFNVTGKTGWANGAGPNDPRGYIYQAAMPAYAQALASHVYEWLENGVLLEDSLAGNTTMPYAFKTSTPNHLVLVRKLNHSYLIYGTIQPNSNYKGNARLTDTTAITLEGKKIQFEIRRQGSMYVLDMSGKEAIFYQLDKWHEYTHPYFWNKNYVTEAEEYNGKKDIFTESKSASCVNYISFIRISGKDTLSYSVSNRERLKYKTIRIRCRKSGANPSGINILNGSNKYTADISNSAWKDVIISVEFPVQQSGWLICAEKGKVDIDFIEWVL